MANTCLDSNLLTYGGTSQAQRILDALSAKYAQVDERSDADLILFAKNYAAYLNYYNSSNAVDGNWQPFMSNDPAIIIADVANWRSKDFINFINGVVDSLQKETDETKAQGLFKSLFDFVATLTTELNTSLKNSGEAVDYNNYLSISIASGLALPLNVLWNYYNTFISAGLINPSIDYDNTTMPVNSIVFAENFDATILSNSPWSVSTFTAPQITLSNAATVIENINTVITHNLFVGALQSYVNGVIKIVAETPAYLDDVLQNYPQHQPHYALYLTFLRLFKFAQNKLNTFTQQHLELYYKTILQLRNADAIPDYVHLLFDLQKNTVDHILKKGTAFKAGKDANNNDLFYTLTDDVVLHQATVQSLKSLYLKKADTSQSLYAFPVANSEDGNGAKLQSADNSWYAFGDPLIINNSQTPTANIGLAVASNILFMNEGKRIITITLQCNNIGSLVTADVAGIFTIQFTGKKSWYTASNYIPLVSGSNIILTVTLDGDAPPIIPYSQKVHGGDFMQQLPIVQLLLSSYQSYKKIKAVAISNILLQVTATVKNLTLQNDDGKINAAKPFKIFGEFPPKGASFIIGSKEIFQKRLTSLQLDIGWQDQPEQKINAKLIALKKGIWSEDLGGDFTLRSTTIVINPTTITQVTPTVQAQAQAQVASNQQQLNIQQNTTARLGLFSLMPLVNEDAAISTMQNIEYNPFNDPQVIGFNSSLALGEMPLVISTPPLILLPIVIDNSTPPTSTPVVPLTATLVGVEKIPASEADFSANEEYDVNSTDGFIKMLLDVDDYNLPTFLWNVQQSIKSTSTKISSVTDTKTNTTTTTFSVDPGASATPVPPAPVVSSITATYTAFETINFANTPDSFLNRSKYFYHIEPFGIREMHPFIINDEALTILPVFNLDGNDNSGGGELWFGLNNVSVPETFTVLFEVADGTSDPLTPMTEVDWYYLSNNNWTPFKTLDVSDQTNNLTRSGIVIFNIPADSLINTTRADNNLLWLKAVADHNTIAVCKLINVSANAAKAVFAQDVSKNIVFTKPLAPSTISKAAIADAAIKKINQPYASFDGRVSETDTQFYTRVSERLRHKNRAMASWDYEKLVLQNYPQVHKVKCINHTAVIIDGTNKKYSETYPGHVTVVTIPDLTNNTATDPLRPYTSIGLLTEIQQYLQKLNSGFVKLHVTNPQFEEVQFVFSVNFTPNHDFTVFARQLNLDIEKFLTPWAYDTNTDIEFGGTIEKSVVLNFIEELDYVDYVTFFTMNHIVSRKGSDITEKIPDVEVAVATTAMSVLVSYKDGDTRHTITPDNKQCNG